MDLPAPGPEPADTAARRQIARISVTPIGGPTAVAGPWPVRPGPGRDRDCPPGGGGMERAIRLYPQHGLAGLRPGQCLQVGQSAQLLVGLLFRVHITGGPALPEVPDAGTGDVVVVIRLRVDPEHTYPRFLRQPVRAVRGHVRHGDPRAEEIQVSKVGQRRGSLAGPRCVGRGCRDGHRREQRGGQGHGQQDRGDPPAGPDCDASSHHP